MIQPQYQVVLSRLQEQICVFYDLPHIVDAADYWIDADARSQIPGAADALPEQFFVSDAHDAIEMALYIDPEILDCLKIHDPWQHLGPHNLEAFCIALEGVSHLLLTAWRACHGESVRPVELEIQAEIDKYFFSTEMLDGLHPDTDGRTPWLRKLFFGRCDLRQTLSDAEIERYRLAHKIAAGYSDWLEQNIALSNPVHRRHALRCFYRSGFDDKIRYA